MDYIKVADISLYGIDDENKNNANSIYYTNINSTNNSILNYTSSTYLTSTTNVETNYNPVVITNYDTPYVLQSNITDNTYTRRFPPKTWNTLGNESNTTLNGIACIRRDFTLNTTGITYGSGTYECYISSVYSPNSTTLTPVMMFNCLVDYQAQNKSAHFNINNYNTTTGLYTGTSYLVENTFLGDWIAIKCPESFILGEYTIYSRYRLPHRTPKTYKLYASTDGINWVTLDNVNHVTQVIYSTANQFKITRSINNSTSYNWYCLTCSAIFTGNSDNLLNFIELEFRTTPITASSTSLINLNFDGNISINNNTINDIYKRPSNYYPILNVKPIAWYKFDDTNLGLDSSGNGYHLTGTNLPTRTTTDFRKGVSSASFDGVNNRLINTNCFNIANKDISVSFWVKRGRSGVSERFMAFGDTNTNYNLLSIGITAANKFIFTIPAAPTTTNYDYTNIGIYYHIVYTYKNSTGSRKLYVNGCLDVTQTQASPFTTNPVFEVGSAISGNFFQGNLDDLRIYEKELTPQEINYLYYSYYYDKSYPIIKRSGVTINPSAWYKADFYSALGTDAMGTYNMTNENSVTGIIGYKGDFSFNFNVTNSLSTTTFPRIDNKNFSICFWSCPLLTDVAQRYVIAENATNIANQSFMMGYNSPTQFRVDWYNNLITYAITDDIDTWSHWCFTFSLVDTPTNNRGRLYRNGVLVAVRDFGNAYLGTSQSWSIGRRELTQYYYGYADDIRVYADIQLTAGEVLEIYKGRADVYRTLATIPDNLNNLTLTNTTFPLIYKDNYKSIDNVNYYIETLPTTFNFNNTKGYKFNIEVLMRGLRLTNKAKIVVESVFIPNIISQSFLQSKAINNVILRMKGLPSDKNYDSSSKGKNNPVIISVPLKINTQSYGTTYAVATEPDKVTRDSMMRDNTNNGTWFINKDINYLYNYQIGKNTFKNNIIEFELIYDIGDCIKYNTNVSEYTSIHQTLSFTEDSKALESFNINFKVMDVDTTNDKIYNEKKLLNKINSLMEL